jgi:hypothetical protein
MYTQFWLENVKAKNRLGHLILGQDNVEMDQKEK